MGNRGSKRGTLVAVLVAAAAAFAAYAAPAGAANLSYTFDADAQEWYESQDDNADTPAGHSALGGNPGGALQTLDTGAETGCPNAPCEKLVYYSPVLALGSLASNFGGRVTFDLASDMVGEEPPEIHIIDPVTNVFILAVPPLQPSVGFHTYSVPLTAGNWSYCAPNCDTAATAAQLQQLLSVATAVDVRVDTRAGTGETYRFDNFKMTEPPPAVAIPAPIAQTPVVAPKRCKKGRKLRRGKCVRKKKKRRK